ncbi:hypothetical protein HDE_07747 [Halotydeus destructor]|nr:hypothetical protein HDE_07747 [Halotydeus destructor]
MGYPATPGASQDRPQPYKGIRIALLVLLGISMIFSLVAAFGTVAAVKENADNNTPEMVEILCYVFWVVFTIDILISLLGFVGAYREHYCMTKGYAVTMTVLNALALSKAGLLDVVGWLNYIESWVTAILAYYVARESLKYTGGVTIVNA